MILYDVNFQNGRILGDFFIRLVKENFFLFKVACLSLTCPFVQEGFYSRTKQFLSLECLV